MDYLQINKQQIAYTLSAVNKKTMAKKFKVHNMYSKTGRTKVAQTMKQHLSLKKAGYTHTKPKKKK